MNEDVAREKRIDLLSARSDSRQVGFKSALLQMCIGDDLALRLGLRDGPVAQNGSSSRHSRSTIRPIIDCSRPSASRVTAPRTTSSGTPYCLAIDSKTA